MSRRGVELAIQGVVGLALVALVAGQLLGQPVLLGFVETGSMEPTIETGDGFVALPAVLTGEPAPGDVVVFEAQEIEDGELTTHRIVDETEQGYTTQGDANPFTDQDSGEQPVQDAQIVATAWELGGDPVTIPSLGTAVMTAGDALDSARTWLATTLGVRSLLGSSSSGLAFLLLGLSIALYAVETVRERRETSFESRLTETDHNLDSRHLCLGFALLVVAGATVAMAVPAGTQSHDIISAEFESEQPLVIEHGTTSEVPYDVPNTGYVPVVSYVEPGSEYVALETDRVAVGAQGQGELELAVTAPDETGHYPAYVTEYRYLHVLPAPVIDVLYDVHPWVPFGAILALFGGGTYALSRYLLGPPDDSVRSRQQGRRKRSRTRSIVRRLY